VKIYLFEKIYISFFLNKTDFNIFKVGIFALAEKDWLTSLSSVKFEHMQYEPFVLAARQLAHDLRTNDVKNE